MIEAGGRYKNIDQALGTGSFLVLGKDVAETVWTKLLPKSGPKFLRVMECLKKAGLPGLALKYKDLSVQVVEHEITLLSRSIGMVQLHRLDVSVPSADLVGWETPATREMTDQSIGDVMLYQPEEYAGLSDLDWDESNLFP